jgi:pimeloyl-ACP methyl ester carboxylesterase
LLAGHSFGANAVMAYMAEVGDADGIIALAPGHVPRYMYETGMARTAVDEARSAVTGGRADDKIKLNDMNQGQRRDFNLPAQILLSYFEPDGLGHMPATAARFKRAVPFMWVIGTRDPLYPSGEGFAYARALPHPQSTYLVVQADHKDTPEVATAKVLAWVRQVVSP